ncbi:MAG: hypothetical protein QOJ89_52 [bacterium]|jgi:hypothetical protein
MKFSNRMRAGTAVVACAAVGAAGGIAGSAAAPSTSKSAKASSSSSASRMPGHPPRGGPGGPGGRAVHAEEVVLDKAGKAFITETEDSGKIASVSGRDVTIAEGIGTVTYKDVTITLPTAATIERNGTSATVDELKAGDRIHVTQSSDGVSVRAGDASFRPGPGGDRDGHGPPWGGPRPG